MNNNAEPVLVWADNTVQVGLPALRSYLTDLYTNGVSHLPILSYPVRGRLTEVWTRTVSVQKNIGGGRVEYTVGIFEPGQENDSKALLYVTVRV